MINSSPDVLVRKNFDYLFDEYEFKISEIRNFPDFGNWVVVLQSDKCFRMRLFLDRGQVMLSFGPIWSPPGWEAGPWYYFSVILTALREETSYSPKIYRTEPQLEELSLIIKPLVSKICDLFSVENYERNKKRLEIITKKIQDETWKSLGKFTDK